MLGCTLESCLIMDAIEEILARLPVKHVLRCKLLSKSCYDLMETPTFIKKHLLLRQQSDSRKTIIVGTKKNSDDNGFSWIAYNLSSSSEARESQLYTQPDLFRILVASCNGLLVFSDGGFSENLTVCNPATRKYTSVPEPPLEHMLNNIKIYRNALGFAYDAESDDYKLIKIGNYTDICGTDSGLFQVWSMKSNSWKQINPSPMPRLISENRLSFRCCYRLLVNGILYWFVRGEDYRGHDQTLLWRDATILSFDPTNDKFGEIALPKEAARHDDIYGINIIDFIGSLALSFSRRDKFIDIWVLGGGSMWTKRFSIGPFPRGLRTAQMCINGNYVLYGCLHWPSGPTENCKIILCDPHRNKAVIEDTVKGLETYSTLATAWSLTESLVSV